ncbi:MFS transporter [Paracoccus shanxieyensis]|uniref:MFS transporter n=1 Tax=Paracoccus shanxieyensis TaxID=2675752 RepID=UPI00313426B1
MQPNTTLKLNEFLDAQPVRGFHWRVLLLCLSVLIMDGFDIVSIGFIAPALIDDWGITKAEMGPVLSAGLFGMALGAFAGGPLADRFGRRNVIVGSVFFFGVMSLLSAWSPNLTVLTALRFLTGLGLGASQPNAATLISEFAPKHRRALFVSFVYCGFTIGAAGGGFLSAQLIATYNWHSILIVGGVVPMVMAVVLHVFLPESARFMALRPARRAELMALVNKIRPGAANAATAFVIDTIPAAKGSVRLILSQPFLLVTLALWVGLFMNNLTVYLLNSWLPVLVKDVGFSFETAARIGAMMQIGGTIGNIVLGWEMDRWNPHRVMALTLLGAVAAALVIGNTAPDETMLMLVILVLGYFCTSANTGWAALAASYYPTEMRATGTAWMTAVGRFGAILGASVGAVMMAAGWGFSQVFSFLALPLSIAAAAAMAKAFLMRRNRRLTETT